MPVQRTLATGQAGPASDKRPFIRPASLLYEGVIIAVFAGLTNEVIARAAARAFDIAPAFEPLAQGNAGLATAMAALAATITLLLLDRATPQADRVFAASAVALLLASFVPVMALVHGSVAGASSGAILTLAAMHFTGFLIIVPWLMRAARASRR